VEDMTSSSLAGPADVLPALARVLSLESRIMERWPQEEGVTSRITVRSDLSWGIMMESCSVCLLFLLETFFLFVIIFFLG